MGYRHTQVGTVIIIAVLAVAFIAIRQLARAYAFHDPVLFVTVAVLVIVLAIFYSLTVEIESGILTCRFGIGLIRKRIPLSRIDQARAVRNPWYLGWGIRGLPGVDSVWNIAGFQAVELVFKDGRKFRIGTDEPETLLRAIEMNKATSP
jgi:hypothetical protein